MSCISRAIRARSAAAASAACWSRSRSSRSARSRSSASRKPPGADVETEDERGDERAGEQASAEATIPRRVACIGRDDRRLDQQRPPHIAGVADGARRRCRGRRAGPVTRPTCPAHQPVAAATPSWTANTGTGQIRRTSSGRVRPRTTSVMNRPPSGPAAIPDTPRGGSVTGVIDGTRTAGRRTTSKTQRASARSWAFDGVQDAHGPILRSVPARLRRPRGAAGRPRRRAARPRSRRAARIRSTAPATRCDVDRRPSSAPPALLGRYRREAVDAGGQEARDDRQRRRTRRPPRRAPAAVCAAASPMPIASSPPTVRYSEHPTISRSTSVSPSDDRHLAARRADGLTQQERREGGDQRHRQHDRGVDREPWPTSTGSRFGTTVIDVRIMPVPYSPLIISTPRTAVASWAKMTPSSRNDVRSAGEVKLSGPPSLPTSRR